MCEKLCDVVQCCVVPHVFPAGSHRKVSQHDTESESVYEPEVEPGSSDETTKKCTSSGIRQ